jgi:hypothetical protein
VDKIAIIPYCEKEIDDLVLSENRLLFEKCGFLV